jgi:hypothetical protein
MTFTEGVDSTWERENKMENGRLYRVYDLVGRRIGVIAIVL